MPGEMADRFGGLEMYRDLLVHVDGSQAGRQRVQFAVDLATRMRARLSGLHVIPRVEVPPLYKPSLVAEVAADVSSKLASGRRRGCDDLRRRGHTTAS